MPAGNEYSRVHLTGRVHPASYTGLPPMPPNSAGLFSPNTCSSDFFFLDGSNLLSPTSSGLLSPNRSGMLSLPPLACAVFPINHSNGGVLNYSKDPLPPCAIPPYLKDGTSQLVQRNGRFFCATALAEMNIHKKYTTEI